MRAEDLVYNMALAVLSKQGSFAVLPSKVHGQGIVATQDLPAGHVLGTALRRAVSPETGESRWHSTGSLGRWLNHSDKPNVKLEPRRGHHLAVLTRPVRSGEEILVDYNHAPREQPAIPRGGLLDKLLTKKAFQDNTALLRKATPNVRNSRDHGFRSLQYLGRVLEPAQHIMPGMGVHVGAEKEKRIREAVAQDPELRDLTVQLGHTGVLSAAGRMLRNPNMNPLGKLVRLPMGLLGGAFGKLEGASHYNPWFHSAHIYGDNVATGLHELGHAKSMQGSMLRGAAPMILGGIGGSINPALGAAAAHLPSLVEEGLASRNATRMMRPDEKEHVGRTLMPAYGSYLGALAAATPGLTPVGRLAAGIGGFAGGGLAGAAYNRMMGRRTTGQALGDAARSVGFGALGALGAAALGGAR